MSFPFSLICAEKPDQSKKLAAPFPHQNKGDHIAIGQCEMFPQGAIVISARGHILEVCEPEEYDSNLRKWSIEPLPFIPEKFKLRISSSTKSYFNAFKKFLNDDEIKLVIHAGDAGREGQLLIDEILYYLNNKKPVKRLWLKSLTKPSVIKALNEMEDNKKYEPMYLEAVARQRADFMIGINATRVLTVLLQQKGINKTFSAGRVQTALMGIIYNREMDIENFKSMPFWDCYADFKFEDYTIRGKWFKEDGEHIFKHESAQALVKFCEGSTVKVYSALKEEKNTRPPQLYHLSTLQSEANRLYGLSPENVLNYAQGLYDKSIISYPRTDSQYLTPEEANWMPTILNNLSKLKEYKDLVPGATGDISNDKRYVDSNKVTDHYGIILTEEETDPTTLQEGERLIFDMIAKSIIAAHYPDYLFNSTEIIISVQNRFTFKVKGKQVKFEGWRSVYNGLPEEQLDEQGQFDEIQLPDVSEGEEGHITSIELKEGATSPPSRFTQGDLVKVMSNPGRYCGEKEDYKNSELSLGTPATRANIISTVTKRYVNVESNLIYLQPEGRILIEALGNGSYLTSVLSTGNMERYLSQIGKGKGSYKTFIERTKQITHNVVDDLKENSTTWQFDNYIHDIQEADKIGSCLLCGDTVIDVGPVYGCQSYKTTNCEFKLYKTISGKAISRTNAVKLLETGTTALIKGFMKKDKTSTYDAYIVWDSNKKTTRFEYVNNRRDKR
ncbi:hypothetical protein AWM68_17450 [Fictibacillus phosphorivorans]|uniref:DNA topoisomerase n=1 Tax=Fictibacillus phosphorivorans TaxID=1221500 RepID=A0A163S1H9_9BACL|nr:type IA DNA topoisomerase [Fictibacillus phosphorivorans]KZE67958.1 hypothetical protein AWM68_17450 [Fictibacillus phosphorivorans]